MSVYVYGHFHGLRLRVGALSVSKCPSAQATDEILVSKWDKTGRSAEYTRFGRFVRAIVEAATSLKSSTLG